MSHHPSPTHVDVTYRCAILLGLLSGMIALIGGIALCAVGIGNSMHLLVEGADLSARLTNASPGVVIVIIGVIIIWRFKPRVTQTTQWHVANQSSPADGINVHCTSYTEHRTSGSRLASTR